jgi:hypothetical protein
MDECSQQWIQQAGGCQANADCVNNQRSIEILKDNSTAAARDTDGFDKLHQVVANENHVGAFAGHIGSCPMATPTVAPLKAGASILARPFGCIDDDRSDCRFQLTIALIHAHMLVAAVPVIASSEGHKLSTPPRFRAVSDI